MAETRKLNDGISLDFFADGALAIRDVNGLAMVLSEENVEELSKALLWRPLPRWHLDAYFLKQPVQVIFADGQTTRVPPQCVKKTT